MSLELPSQQGAQQTLDRILRIAVSRRLPDEHRLELGRAVAWLQGLIDCDVLAAYSPSSSAPAAPVVASVARAGVQVGWGQGETGVGSLS